MLRAEMKLKTNSIDSLGFHLFPSQTTRASNIIRL